MRFMIVSLSHNITSRVNRETVICHLVILEIVTGMGRKLALFPIFARVGILPGRRRLCRPPPRLPATKPGASPSSPRVPRSGNARGGTKLGRKTGQASALGRDGPQGEGRFVRHGCNRLDVLPTGRHHEILNKYRFASLVVAAIDANPAMSRAHQAMTAASNTDFRRAVSSLLASPPPDKRCPSHAPRAQSRCLSCRPPQLQA